MKKPEFKPKLFFALAMGGMIIFLTSSCRRKEMADIVLYNGLCWTGNLSQPWVEAVAIRGEKIWAVGSNKEIKKKTSPEGRWVDLKKALVLPGFIDSHTHFLDGGFALQSLQLKEVSRKEEFVSCLARRAQEVGPGRWITHGDWDHQRFNPPVLPRKEWIDPVTPANPVFITRHDGHMALANSLALKMAGIDRNTPSPPGGEIQKDPSTGEPTGILTDAAMELVSRHIPEPSLAEKIDAGYQAVLHALEHGVTSVHDMGDASHLEVYQELFRQGKLKCRVRLYIPITEVDLLERLHLRGSFGHDFLQLAGLKGFVDGSLGAATALFFEPYVDQPESSGLLHSQMYPEGIMEERIRRADRLGLQVAIHAIGDRANALILDIFERIIAEHGERDRRWRVEHAQHLRREDIGRLARLGIIASMQPYHLADDGCWAEKRIGPERSKTTYAFRSLLDHRVQLAFGSDWTVAPLNPLTGIWAATTRQTVDGKNPSGWVPEEKISVEEAVRAYTLGGAYAEFAEQKKGTLEPGKLADLVVLEENIFTLSPEKIKEAKVIMTIVGGQVVYEAKK